MARMNLPPIHSDMIVDPRARAHSRLDFIEERLISQERTTESLVNRAMKIKEDLVESLSLSRGSWQEEQRARVMLQEHIKTITAVVNKLNHDIVVCENHMTSRDNAMVGTNHALKNLEVHHATNLTDLRGRMVRCDAAISKLAADLRGVHEAMKSHGMQQQDTQGRQLDRIHDLEAKIASFNNLIDKSSSEHRIKIQHVEGETTHRLTMLDQKTKSGIDEVKNLLKSYHLAEQVEREKLEGRLISALEKSDQSQDLKLGKFEQRLDEIIRVTDSRLIKMEEHITQERTHWESVDKTMETKLWSHLDTDLRRSHDDHSRLKRECREGFSTLHETITSMKMVNDGKRKLLEDQLRKEIGQIRKMVVLV